MGTEHDRPEALLPDIAAQLRCALSSLHLAAAQLAPAEDREQDRELDARAAVLDQSFYRLLRLVNEMTAAAVLGGDGPLAVEDFDLVKLVLAVCEEAESLASLLGLDMRFFCPKEHHLCAISPPAMEQLLFHLLSNAFKFTSGGGAVTVELKFSRQQVRLSVADTGCGIPEEELPRLFDRYLHGEVSAPPQGLGLGLALCRRIAEGHGGVMMAESRVGVGSRFTLSIPDRQVGRSGDISDVPFDYTGGFNRALLALADALPPEAFLLRYQD